MRKEILTITTNESNIDVAGNEVNSFRNKNITKKGVRVFKDEKIYGASFVGNTEDDKLVEDALNNESGTLPFDYELPEVKAVQKKTTMSSKGKEDLFSEFTTSVESLKKEFPQFIFSGKANFLSAHKTLKVNETKLVNEFEIADWSLVYKHKKSASIIDGWFGAQSALNFDVNKVVNNYSKYLSVFDKEVSVSEGYVPVVFVQQSFLYPKILQSARADFYKKDVGLFKGKLGELIFNEKFSLYDVSYSPEDMAFSLFDGEGVVRENPSFDLVKNGVFTNLICDSRNAKKYELETTGNTIRSFDSASQLGYNNIRCGKGTKTIETILKDLPECIIVEMAAGGEFTDVGSYSTPVQAGYLAKSGEIVGKIPQITLSSSVEEMFGDRLIDIACNSLSDLEFSPTIFTEMKVTKN